MKRYHIICFFISGIGLSTVANAAGVHDKEIPVTASAYRGVCVSATQLTKYYQQGIEVWGSEVFWDGRSMEAWINEQDSTTGGTGGYTCHVEKAIPLESKFIEAIKKL